MNNNEGWKNVLIWAADNIIFMVLLMNISFIMHDILISLRQKRKNGEITYRMFDSNVKELKVFMIMTGIMVIMIILLSIHFPNFRDLPLILIIASTTIYLGYQIQSKNGIGYSGIFYRGQYYRWNKVQSYQWENDGNIVVFNYLRRFLFIKYNQEIKCKVIPEQKNEIDNLIRKQIGE
ncbi:MAG: hypothetical protein GXY86_10895 [Firmicutes bacterium]|nr:hypothetical protein [Bacillota bacterium]